VAVAAVVATAAATVAGGSAVVEGTKGGGLAWARVPVAAEDEVQERMEREEV